MFAQQQYVDYAIDNLQSATNVHVLNHIPDGMSPRGRSRLKCEPAATSCSCRWKWWRARDDDIIRGYDAVDVSSKNTCALGEAGEAGEAAVADTAEPASDAGGGDKSADEGSVGGAVEAGDCMFVGVAPVLSGGVAYANGGGCGASVWNMAADSSGDMSAGLTLPITLYLDLSD